MNAEISQGTNASMIAGTLTVEQALNKAVAQHHDGQLQEAGELYRDILQSQPNHPEANHNMGVLAVQMKQPAAGLPYFMAALDADPARGQFWVSYIDALFQAGQLEDARQVLALAQQQGLQGDDVNALAARLEGGAQLTEQSNAESQHVFEESLPVSPAAPQDSQKKPKTKTAKPVKQDKSAKKSTLHKEKNPSPQEINTLVALFNEGRYTEAAPIAQAFTERFPLHGFGWNALGVVFQQMGRGADALAPMQKAAALSPNDAEVHLNLGNILNDLGRLNEAEASLRRALQIKPDYAAAHSNLGSTLQDMGRLAEAETSFRRALQVNSNLAEAHYNLGNTLKEMGRLDEAEASYRRALQIKPNYVGVHNNLGVILKDMGRLDEAETSCRRALQINPNYVDAHSNLGNILKDMGLLDAAEASYRRALEIKPDYAEVHNNLGITLNNLGRIDEAIKSYLRAMEIKPDFAEAHSNLIFAMDLTDTVGLSELHGERKKWDEAYAAPLWQDPVHSNAPSPIRRLRVGYVSADFKHHSAPKVFGGMLTRYDRAQFDIFAYSNLKGKADRFTDLFKQSVTVWRNIGGLPDDAVAKMIREDQIDILVDLSGHTGGNRLLVFARKPAPVQITAWGYATGTGMRAMDVFFADPVMVPPEDKPYFAEEVRYLPSVVGAFFIDPFPDVNELPALSGGVITFGSLNRLAKLSDKTYRAWAEVLLAIPRSRLILKTAELNDALTRERVAGQFTKAGVAADRIIMQGKTSWHEHMQTYNQIDLALDPFPHGGGVTALEGLMMGVPMVTLRWPTTAGRLSASIMTTLGLTGWVAETPEEYVGLAIRKAKDLQSLAALRQQLRGIFTSSVIGDPEAYARAVEQEYRQLWQEWCTRQQAQQEILNRHSHSTRLPKNGKQVAGYKPDKSDNNSTLHKGKYPSPHEINTLVALFNEGRYTEAAALAQKMTVRFPLHWVGWKMLGVVFKQTGRSADALVPMQKAAALLPGDAEAHNNLGIILNDLGRLGEAEASYRRALQINPDYAQAHSNLGATLQYLGRLDEAEASYRRALQINPDYAKAHNNLGAILQELGRLDEAEASYRRALQINPDYAGAHSNLGLTLRDLGRLDEAEASYRRALQINPDYVEAHSNLGIILHYLRRLNEAEASYLRALQINPDYVDALNNLAWLLNAQGKPIMALNLIKQSLKIKETGLEKSLFVACVKQLSFSQDDNEIRLALVRALTEPWCRPSELARISADLVKLNPDIGGYVARAVGAWPRRLSAQDIFGSNGLATLAADPLLCALLESAPICDIEMEHFLTMARHALLETAAGMTTSDGEVGAALNFYSALARQCFINEYVFSNTEDEIQKAGDLRDSLAAALEAKTKVPGLWPVAVAAYFPLCSLPLAARLLERPWPEAVTAVLVQQVGEPEEERRLRATISHLTKIEDEVSLLVQSQYEENPYPRWIKVAPAGEAKNIVGYLCQKFPLASFKRHGKSGNIDVLVAGCGTGQHSIGTAQKFQGAQVLAVDLSMSSLGYAKRKTRELGLTSIEYAQADLLKLGSLGRSFDVIESAGVLHHLADPWAGWQVLLSLLRPGGFMRLGFYSEVARRHIVRIRTLIAEQGYGSTAEDIRRCRQDLMELDKNADFGTTLISPDFFSISACRDLLFHVQEHRVTLTRIEAFLRDNHLTFLGFEIEGAVLHAYQQRFPDNRAAINLGQWQIFENENPDTFAGMYQFWIQKNGLRADSITNRNS